MKKFIYTCPRCGRQWVRFIPRRKMKCRFCSEVWHTRGRRSSRSRFSWTATFLWLFWIVLIVSVALWHRQMIDFGKNFIESHPIVKPGVKSNKGAEVPGIGFFEEQKQRDETRRQQEAQESEKTERENGETGEESAPTEGDAEIPSFDEFDVEIPADVPFEPQTGDLPDK